MKAKSAVQDLVVLWYSLPFICSWEREEGCQVRGVPRCGES